MDLSQDVELKELEQTYQATFMLFKICALSTSFIGTT